MFNVANVITNPLFQGARVVAGHAGLQNRVMWVHNAGVPDAPQWLNGGELVLTTYINLPQDEDGQRQYIHEMAARGVAALMLTVGRYIDSAPAHMIEAANTCGFPLIEISYTARFVDIAKAVNVQISQENMMLVQRALTIQKELTRLVLEGGSFLQLAQKLVDFVGHSISIENERFEAIATLNIAEVDEARRYTQQYGRTDDRLVEALETRGYLPRLRETLYPVHLPAMPDVGLEMERILAPIVVHGGIYGYVWIIGDTHSISDLDMMAIESGATIAALIILYQESMQSAEASLKGSLLSQLIQGDIERETVLTDQALRYGVDLRGPCVMLLAEARGSGMQALAQMYRALNTLILAERWPVIVGQFAGEIVLLAQNTPDLPALTQKAFERLVPRPRAEKEVRLGVSGVVQGAQHIRQAYQQCHDVLYITRRLHQARRIAHFDDLGYLHTLYQAGPAGLTSATVPLVRRLLDEKQADLFRTLEAYLDSGGNGVATAEALHIHRSTLNYRLTRIEQVCGVVLQDPAVRMDLQVALKLLRLFEVEMDMRRDDGRMGNVSNGQA